MTTTPQENAALVRGFLTDVVAAGDTDAVGIYLGEDVVEHNLVFGDRPNREAVTSLGWRVLTSADVTVDVRTVVATSEEVTVRAVVSGSHRQSLMDLTPAGASSPSPTRGSAGSTAAESWKSGRFPTVSDSCTRSGHSPTWPRPARKPLRPNTEHDDTQHSDST